MTVYTIGFTKKSAQHFFELVGHSGAQRVVDVRLNNVSQLAGFAKRNDLAYFLKVICSVEYIHLPQLAPTQTMLDEYKKGGGDWDLYEKRFLDLMEARRIEDQVPRDVISEGCLLCSEDRPHHCHRRLVAEYLQKCWGGITIRHLR
jgi:uncharacterized protein (DUF488 family)